MGFRDCGVEVFRFFLGVSFVYSVLGSGFRGDGVNAQTVLCNSLLGSILQTLTKRP